MEVLEANEMVVVEEANETVSPLQSEGEVNSDAMHQEINELKPYKGQQFQTMEEVEQYYTMYAQNIGFDIRNHSTKKSKDNEILRKEFVCNKQGEGPTELTGMEKRRRGVGRENCKARLIVVKSKVGGFVVSIFDEAHTHVLISPRRRHLLKSRRRFSSAQKSLSEQLSMVNIPPHRQFDIFGVQSGGIENIGCTMQDMYNHRRDKCAELKGHDGNMLRDHFMLEQERNSGFTYKIEADDSQRITHCFWSDAHSRKAYGVYSDVIIFDTTYNSNRYGMILAPIMGVNNHGQTIILAGAFLSDETTNSFNWLFREFLKVMPGYAPKMIITDQDPAMTKSISKTLPNTYHRYCSWHILNKFSEKLDMVKYINYWDDFKRCVWTSETRDEFDLRWNDILEKSGLKENKWLQSLYEIRCKWVPAYVNHVFGADMSSSQRAESGHAFFKGYVGKTNSLVDFMIQFNRGLLRQRQKEVIADHADITENPRLKCPIKMEKQMADIYTRKYFYKFQDELWDSYNYNTEFTSESDTTCFFKSYNDDHSGRVREIKYEKSLDLASCSCQMFESAGIPCSHVLSFLLKVRQLHILPDQYILRRWTKSAKSNVVVDNSSVEINVDKSLLEKRSTLFHRYLHVIDKAILNDEARLIFCEGMDSVVDRIEAISIIGSGGGSCIGVSNRPSVTCAASYNEPNSVKFKGSGKRLKKGKEKSKGKRRENGRRCNGCGKMGVAHDKRNCPLLLNR